MSQEEYLNQLKQSFIIMNESHQLSEIIFIIAIVSLAITILIAFWVYKLKRNSDYILKMKTYEFEKNNPEKPFNEIIKEEYKYIKIR